MSLSRRTVVVAAVVLVVAVGIVVVGRKERTDERQRNLDGIAAVRALVGAKLKHPIDYREASGLECLIYGRSGRPFALELCTDPQGRVVEAVDRRGSVPRFYSVTAEPQIATKHIAPDTVQRLLARLKKR